MSTLWGTDQVEVAVVEVAVNFSTNISPVTVSVLTSTEPENEPEKEAPLMEPPVIVGFENDPLFVIELLVLDTVLPILLYMASVCLELKSVLLLS